MASESSMGLWSSLNSEDVPISPNRRANSWLKAAVALVHQENHLVPKINSIRERALVTRDSVKVHFRDFQIYKAALEKVNAEASSLTASSEDLHLDCVRIEGKRAALFPLYKAAAENHALLQLSLDNDLAELKLLKCLLAVVQVNLGKLKESLKNYYTVFGPISTNYVEGAVFLCTISKEMIVDIPLFWSLHNESLKCQSSMVVILLSSKKMLFSCHNGDYDVMFKSIVLLIRLL